MRIKGCGASLFNILLPKQQKITYEKGRHGSPYCRKDGYPQG